MVATVSDLVKAAQAAHDAQQKSIKASQQTAAAVAASRPNGARPAVVAPADATTTTGGAQ